MRISALVFICLACAGHGSEAQALAHTEDGPPKECQNSANHADTSEDLMSDSTAVLQVRVNISHQAAATDGENIIPQELQDFFNGGPQNRHKQTSSETGTVHLGPVDVGPDGVSVSPKFEFGISSDHMVMKIGVGDLREGVNFGVEVSVQSVYAVEGSSLKELFSNCKEKGWSPANPIVMQAEIFAGILENTGWDIKLVKMSGALTIGLPGGFSLKAGKAFGWANKDGYKMQGAHVDVAKIGTGALYVGTRDADDSIRWILGYGPVSLDIVTETKAKEGPGAEAANARASDVPFASLAKQGETCTDDPNFKWNGYGCNAWGSAGNRHPYNCAYRVGAGFRDPNTGLNPEQACCGCGKRANNAIIVDLPNWKWNAYGIRDYGCNAWGSFGNPHPYNCAHRVGAGFASEDGIKPEDACLGCGKGGGRAATCVDNPNFKWNGYGCNAWGSFGNPHPYNCAHRVGAGFHDPGTGLNPEQACCGCGKGGMAKIHALPPNVNG